MKNWLVAYVRLYHEKKTCARLTTLGIEHFLPVQQEFHQWSDRVKKVERILIPMMIFVHVTSEERQQVLSLAAISRFMVLRGSSIPATIPDAQMEQFKFMLNYSEEPIELRLTPFLPGQQVRVIKGPLIGLEGELVTLSGKSKVIVKLNSLGYAQVDMPADFVKLIKQPIKQTIKSV